MEIFGFLSSFVQGIELTTLGELAVMLVLASVLGIILRILKQPLLLAYLATGIVIGSYSYLSMGEGDTIETFSTLGVMFLLFLVGLEMDYKSLKKIGKLSLAIGLGQVIFTSIGGFLIGYYAFGFDFFASIYIAIALTFSSTVIIIKLLSDKGSLTSLHGRAAVGLLLVQDLVVILILIGLNAIAIEGGIDILSLLQTAVGGVALFIIMLLLGRNIFPFIFSRVAKSQELLFLVTLAWLLFFSVTVEQFGFSIEIAGFLGGVALANSAEKYHIASKVRPLRDFFVLVFFVFLGSLMVVSDFEGLLFPIALFSLFVLIGNPLIVMTIMGIMRYKKRTSFLTGVTVAQISEFSLIFATLGLALGHITDQIFALIAAVGVVTITLSTYLIIYAEKVFPYISRFLSIFEKKNAHQEEKDLNISKPIILIGAHRTGRGILKNLKKENFLVAEFDPVIIDELKERGIDCLFADIKDPHFFEDLNLTKTKLIISTSPSLEDNLTIIKKVGAINKNITIISRAENENEALILYKEGVDYTLLPHFLAGKYLSEIIDENLNFENLADLRKRELKMLLNNE